MKFKLDLYVTYPSLIYILYISTRINPTNKETNYFKLTSTNSALRDSRGPFTALGHLHGCYPNVKNRPQHAAHKLTFVNVISRSRNRGKYL
jgi:hypothetical protein